METTALQRIHLSNNLVDHQLNYCPAITGKRREFIQQYLYDSEIYSLDRVTVDCIREYREYVDSLNFAKQSQVMKYRNLLEQVTYAFLIANDKSMKEQMNTCISNRAVRNKVYGFLLMLGINDCHMIDYDVRCAYVDYLNGGIADSKVKEYTKALDLLKLDSIKQDNERYPMKKTELEYANKKIFLQYHPSYEVAMTFYYVRDKKELLFDFSLSAPAMLKRQILKMLNHVLKTKTNRHDRRERYIVPLNLFYQYCALKNIDDIEQITERQIQGFRKSIDGKVGSKTDIYMQLVDNIRKFLFLDAKVTNWKANAWYLERFHIASYRKNPAREIKRFSFGQIEIEENRELLKKYMRDQLGVSQKLALQTIRCQYYAIIDFLRYLDGVGVSVIEATGKEVETYLKIQEEKEIQPEEYNKILISIARFYGYMVIKKEIPKCPIHFNYYLKRTYGKHNDRMVQPEVQMEILKNLKSFPMHLRLMYLHLWCIGLRINEVCSIKADAYYWDGRDAWIKIYQNKMKTEKCVPIPTVLYELMCNYIASNCISADEYIFRSRNGSAYNAGTFCKQFRSKLKEAGITDYSFRAHDFRHSIGTYMYLHGTSIETIRDYLGHRESDMTKQYIDYMPEIIDKANEEYFKTKNGGLSKSAKKGNEKHE